MASLGFLKQIRVPRELLRAVQAFFSVLVLALSGYGTASQTALGFCSWNIPPGMEYGNEAA